MSSSENIYCSKLICRTGLLWFPSDRNEESGAADVALREKVYQSAFAEPRNSIVPNIRRYPRASHASEIFDAQFATHCLLGQVEDLVMASG